MPTEGAPTLETTPRVAAEDAREYALHGLALACAAGGMAHQVRNPLNAMALQLALLSDKIGTHRDLFDACAGNLARLQDQIGRVDDVVRRFVEAADPAGSSGLDAGRMVAESAALFGPEARRRHGAIEVRVAAPGLRARGDGARAARLWVGLVWRALEEAGEAGEVRLSALADGAEVVLSLEHPRAAPGRAPAWIAEAAAAAARALGGSLEETVADGIARVALRLPAEVR
jgi:signal transduction histidine kinase